MNVMVYILILSAIMLFDKNQVVGMTVYIDLSCDPVDDCYSVLTVA